MLYLKAYKFDPSSFYLFCEQDTRKKRQNNYVNIHVLKL